MDTYVNITGYSARITKADGGYITGKVIGITGGDGQDFILLDSGERVSTRKVSLVSVEGGLILAGPGATLTDFREIGQTEIEDILEGYRDRGPLFPASVYVSLIGVSNPVEDDTPTEVQDQSLPENPVEDDTPTEIQDQSLPENPVEDDTPTEIQDQSLPEPQNIFDPPRRSRRANR
jgi:hypothetical protein